MLFLLLALQGAPPVPPPPRDRMQAAVAFFEHHPPSAADEQAAIDAALHAIARYTLLEARQATQGARWLQRSDALVARFRARVPADRTDLRRAALTCRAESLGWALEAADIAAADTFFATAAGARFWEASGLRTRALDRCYENWIVYRIDTRAELRAIGLRTRRPRQPSNFTP